MGRTQLTRLAAIAAALVALVALTASALAQPQPSHRFYGSGVTIDGEAAPAGTSISAWVDNEVVGSTTTAADGSWYIDVAGGNTVAFSVGDLVAEGTHESSVGGQSNVSLAVTTPPPPPPPEPECPEEGMMDDGMMGDDESMMGDDESMMGDDEESMMDEGAGEDSMAGDDESMMDDSLEGDSGMMADDCPEPMDDMDGEDAMDGDGMDDGMENGMEDDGAMDYEDTSGVNGLGTGGSGGLAHEGGLSAGLTALIVILTVTALGGAGLTAIRLRNRA